MINSTPVEFVPIPASTMKFFECEACSLQPGTPTLCDDCIVLRNAAGKLWLGPRIRVNKERGTGVLPDLTADVPDAKSKQLQASWLKLCTVAAAARALLDGGRDDLLRRSVLRKALENLNNAPPMFMPTSKALADDPQDPVDASRNQLLAAISAQLVVIGEVSRNNRAGYLLTLAQVHATLFPPSHFPPREDR